MPHSDLPSYRDGFFQKFLAELPGTPSLSTLEERQPEGQPLSVLGDYIQYTGNAITPVANASITPDFAIRTGSGDSSRTYVMVWVVERLDVATDPTATMARILADFRSPTDPEAGTDSTVLDNSLASSWAEALSAEGVRHALAQDLNNITAVPDELPTDDLEELHTFLLHFGTYKSDGTYYAKGEVTEGEFPEGVNSGYLAADTHNLSEVRLQRDHFYCYAFVSERLWNPQAPTTKYRQLVYRIEDQGEDAGDRWRLALLHTVSANRSDTTAISRFTFFHADEGIGLSVTGHARSSLAPSTAEFLDELPDHLAELVNALQNPDVPIVGTEQAPYILLLGAVAENFPSTSLPEGVIVGGEGESRTFRCPPARINELFQRDDINNLELSTPIWTAMNNAMTRINLGGRTLPSGITAANTGQGVLVGIIDTGIDGGHPAFLGRQDDPTKSRIHSVWQMWRSGGQSPRQRSSAANRAAYSTMNFGREFIGHNEVITTNDFSTRANGTHRHGHGTHVAGIAAGRATGAWPGGIAPAATIVVASTGGSGGYVNDVIAGVRYCFQKATELGLPCVVNISLGTSRHSHDGTDPLSIALAQLVSTNTVRATGPSSRLASAMPEYINGRIICASAGNDRNDRIHWQATVAAGSNVSFLYQPYRAGNTTNTNDGLSFWAYNEDGTGARLRLSARHSSNAVLATPEVGPQASGAGVTTNLPGSIRVRIHNGPERPNNRHFNPEIYWNRPAPATATTSAPWIVTIRNTGHSACIIHAYTAFREHRGAFVFDDTQNQSLLGHTYSPEQLAQFNSHKVSTPGTSHGTIGVAAFTSRPGMAGNNPVDEIAPFSSPGPLRAAGAGQRAIDVAAPGHTISSAKSWTPSDASRGVLDMSGTSMSSPVMTGLVAGLLQINSALDTGEIRTKIESSSSRRTDPVTGRVIDNVDDWGLGRIDASLFLTP